MIGYPPKGLVVLLSAADLGLGKSRNRHSSPGLGGLRAGFLLLSVLCLTACAQGNHCKGVLAEQVPPQLREVRVGPGERALLERYGIDLESAVLLVGNSKLILSQLFTLTLVYVVPSSLSERVWVIDVATSTSIPLPSHAGRFHLIRDPTAEIGSALRVPGLPTLIVFERGACVFQWDGFRPEDYFLLNEVFATGNYNVVHRDQPSVLLRERGCLLPNESCKALLLFLSTSCGVCQKALPCVLEVLADVRHQVPLCLSVVLQDAVPPEKWQELREAYSRGPMSEFLSQNNIKLHDRGVSQYRIKEIVQSVSRYLSDAVVINDWQGLLSQCYGVRSPATLLVLDSACREESRVNFSEGTGPPSMSVRTVVEDVLKGKEDR